MAAYEHRTFDAIYVIYNEFKSVIQQGIVVERLLPCDNSRVHIQNTQLTISTSMPEDFQRPDSQVC
jgi:F0F1-type ATP synthase gamma subunit